MEQVILILSIIVGTFSILFSVKTLVETRRESYDDFLKKRNERNQKI